EWVERGEKVILVREETNPDDVHGMYASEGILTARGGKTSHAAVVARGAGKPCIVGAEGIHIDLNSRAVTFGDKTLPEGDVIWIFRAMDGLPVTIRLLDPPLHEFLPNSKDLAIELERVRIASSIVKLAELEKAEASERKLLDAVERMEESNPMLGLRGCRL